jgi:CRP-like cAMP-binding protein
LKHVDALTYLPATRITEAAKGTPVYSATYPPNRLYLVVAGRVRIDRLAEAGVRTLVRIVGPEQLFGGCSLIEMACPGREAALSIEATQLMSWTAEEIDRQIEEQPRLGLALCEYFGSANALTAERISATIRFTIGPRVTIALMQLAQTTGRVRSDGAMRLTGLTHQAISEYVGTSREIVTCEMNRLRRLGYLTYTRLYTDVYVDALAEWMRERGMPYRTYKPMTQTV